MRSETMFRKSVIPVVLKQNNVSHLCFRRLLKYFTRIQKQKHTCDTLFWFNKTVRGIKRKLLIAISDLWVLSYVNTSVIFRYIRNFYQNSNLKRDKNRFIISETVKYVILLITDSIIFVTGYLSKSCKKTFIETLYVRNDASNANFVFVRRRNVNILLSFPGNDFFVLSTLP